MSITVYRPYETYDWDDFNPASLALLRLRWELRPGATVAESVKVLREITDPYSPQDDFIKSDGSMHRVAAASVFCQPVSSVEVRLEMLNGRLYDDDDGDDDFNNDDGDEDEDDDSSVATDGGPWKGPKITVTPAKGDFVTIGDFVLAAHAWLLEMRPAALRERGLRFGGAELPADTETWVDHHSASPLDLFDTVYGLPMKLRWETWAHSAANRLSGSTATEAGEESDGYVDSSMGYIRG